MNGSRSKRRGGLRAWSMGCGLIAAVPLLFVAVVRGRTCAPLQSAGEARAELLARYGDAGQFTLAADGAISADRILRFLQVRRSLDDVCERFGGIQGSMQRVDDLSDCDDATGEEIAETAGGMASVAASITPLIGEFFERRNRALLAAEMGFGEYTYLYVLAYRDRLLDTSGPRGIFTPRGQIRPEAGQALQSILLRQVGGLEGGEEDEQVRVLLRREIAALESEPQRVPFSDALPPATDASLAPFRSELDAGFCTALAEIELDLKAGPALLDAIY